MSTDVNNMNKGELQVFAREKYGVELDMRKTFTALQKEVQKLAQPKTEAEIEEESKPKPPFYKNKTTGLIFPYTLMLERRGDLLPCDEAGNPV